jgi:hypothetical protein
MKKPTNAELISENAELKTLLDSYKQKDLTIRTDLSKLLDSYTYESRYRYGDKEKKVDVQSWLGIAFMIGELKADADFSILLLREEDHKRTIKALNQRLMEADPKTIITQKSL